MANTKAKPNDLDKCKGEPRKNASLSFFTTKLFEEMSAASSCKHRSKMWRAVSLAEQKDTTLVSSFTEFTFIE